MANIKTKFYANDSVTSDKLSQAVRDSITDAQADASQALSDAGTALTIANAAIPAAEKGAAEGVAPLGSDSKISSAYLPSYVDDVLEYANLASFPGTGESGKIYVAIDSGQTYRWSGSVYVLIASGAVQSVNGETGVVVLNTDEVAEGSTNKYFSNALALAAAVQSGTITDGVTKAPTHDAVYDALALKQNVLTFAKETKTLSGSNITAQSVTLAQTPKANSLLMWIDGVMQVEGEDFTLSGAVVSFAGDLATGGTSELIAGDKLRFAYSY